MDKNEILALIGTKAEGFYWDFKKEWYKDNQKNEILIDVICMANNLTSHDGYIIIGIDEKSDFSICDISNDPNRRTTDFFVNFLRGKPFAGGNIPAVSVESVIIDGNTIDVIIIKNTIRVPYYLEEHFQDIREGNIYVRLDGSNTPKDETAHYNEVEELWRKRFRLNQTPLETVRLALFDTDKWFPVAGDDLGRMYYSPNPEYTLTVERENRHDFFYYMLGTYPIEFTEHWEVVTLSYHQTALAQVSMIGIDNAMCWVSEPYQRYIQFNDSDDEGMFIYYLQKDSIPYALNTLLCKVDTPRSALAYDNFKTPLFVVEDEKEIGAFSNVLSESHQAISAKVADNKYEVPSTQGLPDKYDADAITEMYSMALAAKELFYEWKYSRDDVK